MRMPRNYYYLVAGLPDIVLDNTKKGLPLASVLDEILEQTAPSDRALFTLLFYQYDNNNLITILENTGGEFDTRGNFSQEELAQEIKIPSILPGYMQQFVESYKEGKLPFPELSLSDQLSWCYYDFITAHENDFIREWMTFDLNLRNVLAGLNSRKLEESGWAGATQFSRERSIICRNEVAELILKSTAPDFSLASRFAWVEKLLSFNRETVVEYEKNIDLLRWEMLDALTTFSCFQIETLLAFYIKLGMVERWQELAPETGKAALDKLLAEFSTGYTIMEKS